MKRRLFPHLIVPGMVFALVAALGGFAPHLYADVQADIDALVRASKARAAIVKRVSPAVVHIAVEKTVTGQAPQSQAPDFFDDEAFRRFFQPRSGKPRLPDAPPTVDPSARLRPRCSAAHRRRGGHPP